MNIKIAFAVSLTLFLAIHSDAPDAKKPNPATCQDVQTHAAVLIFEKAGLNGKSVGCVFVGAQGADGDITKQSDSQLGAAHIIVNAAKGSLLGGDGVDGAVHKAAGAELKKWIAQNIPCIRPGIRCKVGQAYATPAFNLAKQGIQHIIHTVGPQDTTPNRAILLRDAYKNSLELGCRLALQNPGIKSIAFPSISTGIYGYPIEEAAKIALETIATIIEEGDFPLNQVRIVLWPDNYQAYHDAAHALYVAKNKLQANGNALRYKSIVQIEHCA
jgi:O-acetyl-ADP-ribose deacetylase (regulator of RNase III)